MKLTPKEIKEQKAKFGSEAVNYFIRFMEMRERCKNLPDYFIKQVIENSEDIRYYKSTKTTNLRNYKRKLENLIIKNCNNENTILNKKNS